MSNGTGSVGNRMLKSRARWRGITAAGTLGKAARKSKTKGRATRYKKKRTMRAGESTGSSAWTTFILGPSR